MSLMPLLTQFYSDMLTHPHNYACWTKGELLNKCKQDSNFCQGLGQLNSFFHYVKITHHCLTAKIGDGEGEKYSIFIYGWVITNLSISSSFMGNRIIKNCHYQKVDREMWFWKWISRGEKITLTAANTRFQNYYKKGILWVLNIWNYYVGQIRCLFQLMINVIFAGNNDISNVHIKTSCVTFLILHGNFWRLIMTQ